MANAAPLAGSAGESDERRLTAASTPRALPQVLLAGGAAPLATADRSDGRPESRERSDAFSLASFPERLGLAIRQQLCNLCRFDSVSVEKR